MNTSGQPIRTTGVEIFLSANAFENAAAVTTHQRVIFQCHHQIRRVGEKLGARARQSVW